VGGGSLEMRGCGRSRRVEGGASGSVRKEADVEWIRFGGVKGSMCES
jgi:hypothetical protein